MCPPYLFQSSVIHLLSNIAALWFVGGFFENYVGRIKLVIIFVIGLIIPGCLLALIYPDGLHYGASPAIVAVRDQYDVGFEIDENALKLKGSPIPTY